MTAVYVLTAGSGDTYRIERVYLDSDEAYGFAQDFNGIAPVEPVQVPGWQTGSPPAYDGPYLRADWWARVPVSKRRGALRHTDEGERFDDFAIRQEWWTGEALPDAKVVRRELAGVPKVEVIGRSKEKVEKLVWDTITRSGPTRPESQGNNFCSVHGCSGLAESPLRIAEGGGALGPRVASRSPKPWGRASALRIHQRPDSR